MFGPRRHCKGRVDLITSFDRAKRPIGSYIRIALCSIVLCLFGCWNSRDFERKVVTQITDTCKDPQRACRIRLSDLTAFDWDRFYAFPYNATPNDRQIALGMNDSGYRDLERQIVFTKSGKVVFQETEPTNPENPIKDEVIFDMPSDATYASYPHDAVFSVEKANGPEGTYYVLRQIK
jgi:hypothetical protein